MRGRKKRALILGILCCLLVFMGVGFAVARTTLNIGGTSTAINTWDVRMANISVSSKSDGVTNSEEETKIGDDGVSANLQADFIKPGDYITYEVLVENNGTLDATLNELEVDISTDNEADKDLFKVENTLPENKKLTAGESITFTITITFNKDAEKLPSGEVRFNVGLNYSQGEGLEGGGNLPGGTEPESDWLFEVDETGEIISYNYNSSLTETPQDVVVPAEVNGIPVTTITEQSFMPKGNFEAYMDNSAGKIYALIREDNKTIVDVANNRTAAEVVVEKALVALTYEDCQGNDSCIGNYKSMAYLCTDKNTCYQYTDDTKAIVAMPGTVELMASININSDPAEDAFNSISDLEAKVSTLDLSNATNLTAIEDNALSDVGLESVDFGDNSSVTTIGENAFADNALTEVEIPASVQEIGNNAFANNQIETLILETEGGVENQLTNNNQYSLRKLGTTPKPMATTLKGVKRIGNGAFYNNKIKNLKIPVTLESVGSSAFSNNQISELVIPKTLTSLGSSAFSNNPIEKLTIGKCTTDICSSNSFGTSLKTLTIESGEIGDYAFGSSESSTTKIESLTLGEGVTSIGLFAFRNNQISELIIPKSVTTLESSAFTNNPIEKLTIGKCTTNSCSYNSFGTQIKTLTVESGEIGHAAFYNNSNLTSVTLKEGVTSIGSSAFGDCGLTSIILPEGLLNIEYSAFARNSISGELVLPSTLITLEDSAFAENQINGKLVIPKKMVKIGGGIYGGAFRGNLIESLEFEVGSELLEIGTGAFAGNLISGNVVLPSKLTNIGGEAFYNNQITGEIIIPSTVVTIEGGVFQSNQITSLVFEEGSKLSEIGSYSFRSNLISGELNLPNSLSVIGGSAFLSNQISGELLIPATVASLEESAFRGNQIDKLTFEDDSMLTKLPQNVFSNNKISGELVIPDGVTTIGAWAFCHNRISSIVIPSSVKEINSQAFNEQQDSDNYYRNTLTSIIIKRTESDFLSNVTINDIGDYGWYDRFLNPTITYDPS